MNNIIRKTFHAIIVFSNSNSSLKLWMEDPWGLDYVKWLTKYMLLKKLSCILHTHSHNNIHIFISYLNVYSLLVAFHILLFTLHCSPVEYILTIMTSVYQFPSLVLVKDVMFSIDVFHHLLRNWVFASYPTSIILLNVSVRWGALLLPHP